MNNRRATGKEGSILPVKGAEDGRGGGSVLGGKVGCDLIDERLEAEDVEEQ